MYFTTHYWNNLIGENDRRRCKEAFYRSSSHLRFLISYYLFFSLNAIDIADNYKLIESYF